MKINHKYYNFLKSIQKLKIRDELKYLNRVREAIYYDFNFITGKHELPTKVRNRLYDKFTNRYEELCQQRLLKIQQYVKGIKQTNLPLFAILVNDYARLVKKVNTDNYIPKGQDILNFIDKFMLKIN